MSFTITPGCFGKLPIYPDFLRHQASGAALQALDQWIQEGLVALRRHLGRGWEALYDRAPWWRFLYAPDPGLPPLLGVLRPGQDTGGRRYPFLMFLEIRGTRSIPLPLLPLMFQQTLEGLALACQEAPNQKTPTDLFQTLEGLSLEPDGTVPETYARQLQAFSLKTLWEMVFGGGLSHRRYVLEGYLGAVLRPLRGRSPDRLGIGLHFPLAPGPREQVDLPFWVDLMTAWIGKPPEGLVLFWCREGESIPGLLVWFRRPSARSFRFLVQPGADDEAWFDVAPTQIQDLARIRAQIPETRRIWLEEGDRTLAAFLEATQRDG